MSGVKERMMANNVIVTVKEIKGKLEEEILT